MNLKRLTHADVAKGASEWLKPHFRVISLDGERRGFRLETIFWTALAAIAQRNGRTVAREIELTLGRNTQTPNQSAYLRARVASDLMDLWSLSAQRRPDWLKVLHASPVGAFVINRGRRVVFANEALCRYFAARGLTATPGETPSCDISVEFAPHAERGDQAYATLQMIFTASHNRVAARVRLAEASEPGALLGLQVGFLAQD